MLIEIHLAHPMDVKCIPAILSMTFLHEMRYSR